MEATRALAGVAYRDGRHLETMTAVSIMCPYNWRVVQVR